MLIPGVPIKRDSSGVPGRKLHGLVPFPHLAAGKQVLLGCAREALLYGIRLLDSMPRTAHVPAYCCRSVLSPLHKLGIRIRFYDVGSYLDPIVNWRTLKRGDLFLLVHYFGFSQDAESIKKMCDHIGTVMVEDCAHALPDPQGKYPMGTIGIFSIFSLRKQLPVPDGGVLVLNDENLQTKMGTIPSYHLQSNSVKKKFINGLDCFAFAFGWPNTLLIKDKLRGKLQSTDAGFYARLADEMKPTVAVSTLEFLEGADWVRICQVRRRNYLLMAKKLSKISGAVVPFASLPHGSVPQSLPVQVRDANAIRQRMRKKGIGLDRWPGVELPEHVSAGAFPMSWQWHKKTVLMPVHQDLKAKHVEICVSILEKSLHE